MSKKIHISSPESAPDPLEVAAEHHVAEIMGPAWGQDTPRAGSPVVAADAAPAPTSPSMAGSSEIPENIPPTELDTATDDIDVATVATPDSDNLTLSDEPQSLQSEPTAPSDAQDADTPSSANDPSAVVMKESWVDRFKEKFYRWWDNKVARYITLGAIVLVFGVVLGVPAIRTGAMNLVGFRATVSVYAVDATTLQPLKGATLSVDDKAIATDQDGKAKLTGVKLGHRTVLVHKAGFADVKQDISFGFRAVDLGEVDMKATGLQLGFTFTDYLSGKPIEGVTLESGESSTKSDKKGKAIITLAPDSSAESISIQKNGYRTEQVSTRADQGSTRAIKLVLAAKEVYIARENGVYNLKKVDIDGKNDAVLLAGTGNETSSIDVSVDPLSQYAALISTRDATKDKDGYLLSALTLVALSSGDSQTIEHAEKISVVGWSGTTLLYKQVVAGASAANPSREKLMAYDYATAKRYQIASANHFLGAELYSGNLYYTVSSTDPNAKSGVMRAALDGSNKKVIQEADIWAAYRLNYKTLRLQTPDKWYDYTFGSSSAEVQAATSVSRSYIDSSDTKLSAWSDPAATIGNLSVYNTATGKDQTLAKIKGQYKPVRWLNNRVLVYRMATKTDAVEYALSLDGGEAVKIATTLVY